jgi:uncharacterized protein YggE
VDTGENRAVIPTPLLEIRRLTMRMFTAALLAASCLAQPALSQEEAKSRPSVISVAGTGEAQLKPDFARLLVSVSTQADTVPPAVEANRSATERVLARIQALGIKREDIRTENFQVYQSPPRVGPDGREMKTPRFTVNHQLRIVSRDLDGVGKLTGEIVASGDMLFQSLSWGLDKQDEAGDEARRDAVRDARRQAEVYAAAAQVKLGRLLEIRDGSAQPFEDAPMMRMAAKAADAVPIVPPATVRYRANIQMVWEIAP